MLGLVLWIQHTPRQKRGHRGIATQTLITYVIQCAKCDFKKTFFTFFYCSSTVVSTFPPPLLPTTAIPTSHPRSYSALVLSMRPLYMFLKTPPLFPLWNTVWSFLRKLKMCLSTQCWDYTLRALKHQSKRT